MPRALSKRVGLYCYIQETPHSVSWVCVRRRCVLLVVAVYFERQPVKVDREERGDQREREEVDVVRPEEGGERRGRG